VCIYIYIHTHIESWCSFVFRPFIRYGLYDGNLIRSGKNVKKKLLDVGMKIQKTDNFSVIYIQGVRARVIQKYMLMF